MTRPNQLLLSDDPGFAPDLDLTDITFDLIDLGLTTDNASASSSQLSLPTIGSSSRDGALRFVIPNVDLRSSSRAASLGGHSEDGRRRWSTIIKEQVSHQLL